MGATLGLLALKPHLALGIGFLVLISRQWRILLWALATVSATSLVATAAFGPGIWNAFLAATRLAGMNMERGLYPFFRMTSLYATLFTIGLPPRIALACQALLGLTALGSVALAWRLRWPLRRLLGVSALATLAISPYNYDYDMPILGIALALLSRDLIANAKPSELLVLLAALWLCCGTGFVVTTYLMPGSGTYDPYRWLALGGIGFILTACLIWRILWRCPLEAHVA